MGTSIVRVGKVLTGGEPVEFESPLWHHSILKGIWLHPQNTMMY